MQSTLTLTDGTNPHTFTYRQTDASGNHTWTATSPQGDLTGVFSAERRSTKTRANIVSRNFKTTTPYYNATSGKYEGTVQVRTVTNAPESIPLDFVEEALLRHNSAFDPATNAAQIEDYMNGY